MPLASLPRDEGLAGGGQMGGETALQIRIHVGRGIQLARVGGEIEFDPALTRLGVQHLPTVVANAGARDLEGDRIVQDAHHRPRWHLAALDEW